MGGCWFGLQRSTVCLWLYLWVQYNRNGVVPLVIVSYVHSTALCGMIFCLLLGKVHKVPPLVGGGALAGALEGIALPPGRLLRIEYKWKRLPIVALC